MNKNVIIGLLTAVSLASMVFGYSQKVSADEQKTIALEYMRKATEAENRAKQIQEEAALQIQQAVQEAEAARLRAELAMKAAMERKRK